MREIKREYPNAYESWDEEEERLLLDLFKEGKSNREISQILKRQPGAINSRLGKLGIIEHPRFLLNFP